jgi:hypothetical protein
MWSHQLCLPTGLEAFHGLGVDVESNAVADRADHAGRNRHLGVEQKAARDGDAADLPGDLIEFHRLDISHPLPSAIIDVCAGSDVQLLLVLGRRWVDDEARCSRHGGRSRLEREIAPSPSRPRERSRAGRNRGASPSDRA